MDERLEKIWNLHHKIHGKIRKRSMRYYQEIGVSYKEVLLFNTVRINPNITLGELSALLGLSKSTASSMVTRMVESGIIIREVPSDNRRIVHLRISPDYKSKPAIIEKRNQMISELFSEMNDEDIKEALKGLELMHALMKE